MIPEDPKQALSMFATNINSFVQKPVNSNAISSDATLYIGNVHPAISDIDLFNYFRPYGEILSCRIMKDVYTSESRGFAFLTCKTKEDAKNAKDALNYQKINGWEIRIFFKKSFTEFNPKANIFVNNIPKEVTTKQLDELCQQFGPVLSCVVRTDKSGESLGYGYVQYDTEESAGRAVKALDNVEKWDSTLYAQFFVPSKQRQHEQKNLYIKNFPKSWTKEEVEKFVEGLKSYGTVTCAGVYENKPNPETVRYYAFLAYESEEVAKKVIEEFNSKKLKGHEESEDEEGKLLVTIAMSKRVRRDQLKKKHLTLNNLTNLFIKSLKGTVTEEQIREAFGKYGNITSTCLREAKPVPFRPVENLKFGFINFSNGSEATEAFCKGKNDPDILALLHESHPSHLEFLCYAQPKALRAQFVRMRQNMMMSMAQEPMPVMMRPHQRRPARNGNYVKGRRPQYIGNMPMPMTMIDPANINLMQPIDNFGLGAFNIPSPSNPFSTPAPLNRQNEPKEPEYDINWLKHSKKEFMNFEPDKQRKVLGNLMFAKIQSTKLASSENVSKVTGMLIDLEILDYEEIIDMLENVESLKERVDEALEVINDSD